MYFSFPEGAAGIGLLLLRTGVGAAAVLNAAVELARRDEPALWSRALAPVGLLAGVSLMLGALTPVGAAAALAVSLAALAGAFPPAAWPPFGLAACCAASALACALVGPGAYSLDARLFGRREIIIPGKTRPPRSG